MQIPPCEVALMKGQDNIVKAVDAFKSAEQKNIFMEVIIYSHREFEMGFLLNANTSNHKSTLVGDMLMLQSVPMAIGHDAVVVFI